MSLPAFLLQSRCASAVRFWRIGENLNSSAGEAVFAPLNSLVALLPLRRSCCPIQGLGEILNSRSTEVDQAGACG